MTKATPSTSTSFRSIVADMVIVAKLVLFAIYSSLQVLAKNLFVPKQLLEKAMYNQVVVITGAGSYELL
jgi:hypothetical protein